MGYLRLSELHAPAACRAQLVVFSTLQAFEFEILISSPLAQLRAAVMVVKSISCLDLSGAYHAPDFLAAVWAACRDFDMAGKRLHQRSYEDLAAAVDSVHRECAALELFVLVGGDGLVVEEATAVAQLEEGVRAKTCRVLGLVL